MSGKQLSIIVQAKDQATGVLRTVGSGVLQIGNEADKSDKKTRGWLSSLTKGLGAAKLALGGLVAGFAAHRLISSFRAATTELDKLGKAARQYGLSVQEISGLKYAGDLANVEVDALLSGLGTFSKALGQYQLTGGGKAAEAIKLLQQWGVSVKGANDQLRPMNHLLPEIADAFERMGPATREFFASKLGLGGDVGRLLSEGGARLRFYFEEAERLGVIFTPEQTEAAEAFNDAITSVGAAWMGLKARVVRDVAPAMTEVLRGLAGFLAAVPEMVGNLAGSIRMAFGAGPEAEESRVRLKAWLTSLGSLAKESILGGGRIALAAVRVVLDSIFRDADGGIEQWFKRLALKLPSWISIAYNEGKRALNESASGLGLPAFLVNREERIIGEQLEQAYDRLAVIDRQFAMSADRLKAVGPLADNLSDYPQMAATISDVDRRITQAAANFGKATDAVVGYTEAIAKTSITGLTPPNRPGGRKAGIEDSGLIAPTSFSTGVREGFKELINQARDLEAQGRQMVLGIAGAFSNNLSGAISDVISGVQNLKDAFRGFLTSTLQQVSQLIIQMLVLRAIGGIAGAFAAGGGGAVGANPGTIGAPGVQNPTGVVVNSGGYITGHGLRRFAGGVVALGAAGMVPGPNVNRDIVPALLTPGESVITRRGTAANDHATLAYMNRGGRVEPAGSSGGGAGPVNVSVVVNVNGGAGPAGPETIRRAVEEGVGEALIRALQRRPGQRDELRRVLA